MISFTTIFWRAALLTIACSYCGGMDPITFFAEMPQDFLDGWHGRPAQMRYRPGWQNEES